MNRWNDALDEAKQAQLLLTEANRDQAQSLVARNKWLMEAHKLGGSFEDLAAPLGLTEGIVRSIVADCPTCGRAR